MAKKYLDLTGLTKYDGKIKTYIGQQISEANHLRYEIVDDTTKVTEEGVIYLISKGTDLTGSDVYTEYMLINSKPEIVGDTAVDLSNYYTKDAADGKFAGKSTATTSANGLMSATDKTKLDGLTNYTLPAATTNNLGGVKVGNNLSVTADGTLSAVDSYIKSITGGVNSMTFTTNGHSFDNGMNTVTVTITPQIKVISDITAPTNDVKNVEGIAFDSDDFTITQPSGAGDADKFVDVKINTITDSEIEALFA